MSQRWKVRIIDANEDRIIFEDEDGSGSVWQLIPKPWPADLPAIPPEEQVAAAMSYLRKLLDLPDGEPDG